MRKVIGWALVVLVFAWPADAQEVRGNISGTVRDDGGVVPGASVEITNTDTGISQRLIT